MVRRGRGLRGGRGKGREVGEGGEGGEEGCHLSGSLPEIGRAQVGGAGCAAEEVEDCVVLRAALRAQWGGDSMDPVEVVPHGRREARPQLREGGPGVTGEAFLLGAHWRGRLSEDPIWGV